MQSNYVYARKASLIFAFPTYIEAYIRFDGSIKIQEEVHLMHWKEAQPSHIFQTILFEKQKVKKG